MRARVCVWRCACVCVGVKVASDVKPLEHHVLQSLEEEKLSESADRLMTFSHTQRDRESE